jgi:predicted nucleic acid-binding protein
MQALKGYLQPFQIHWPASDDFERSFRVFTEKRLSHNLGLMDSLIGSTAIGSDSVLCTFNVRHMSVMSGLVTEQPCERQI